MKAIDRMSQEEVNRANDINDIVNTAIHSYMGSSERSEWAKANQIGVSDIGHCREYLRRTLINEPFSDEQTEFAAAFMGTAIGELAEKAVVRSLPHYNIQTQLSVTVRLVVQGYELLVPGHPDLLIGHTVVDFKTKDGLGVVRREGPTDKEWWQVLLYTKALIDEGRIDADKAWMVVCFIDRSGREPVPVSYARKFDASLLSEVYLWMEDVIYAVQQDEEASRDMPRAWCWECCPRVSACRGRDTDVEGLIENEVFVDAVRVYNAARDAKRAAEKDLKSAQSVLANISGVVDGNVVRWVDVGPTEIAGFTRSGYRKLDIRPVPKNKGRGRS